MRSITVRLGVKMRRFLLILLMFFIGIGNVFAEEIVGVPVERPLVDGYYPYVAKKDEVIYTSSQYKINKFDPTVTTNSEGKNMPGARGTNQLVIYTPAYGNSTGTNEYGYEAIVVGNTVVELSGANSPIPADGFVISGHGKAKNWINSSIKIGTKVFVDFENMTIYIYDTSESFLYFANKKLEETQQMIDFYSQNNPNFNSRSSNLYTDDAKKYLKKAKKNPQSVKKYVPMAIEASNDALKSTIPYKQNEMKGVWIRPTERCANEVKNTVKQLKKLGINAVFLETFYHGKTIYPSKLMATYGFLPQNEQFVGFDPLKVWSDECKKEKIKLHIWFETFYVGNDNPASNPQHILFLNPEWGNKNKKEYLSQTPVKVSTEHNGYFLDPANPEVRSFILGLLDEIITLYRPDGINLDYIRYPQAVSEMNIWGYTPIARKQFMQQYSIDPVEIQEVEQLVAWSNYRRSLITSMVKSASELCRKNKIYLSTVIFPDRLSAFTTKLQDWKNWSQNGYIDGVTPLFLTCDSKTASESIKKVSSTISSKTQLFAGIFVMFIGGSPDDLIRQLHEARKLDIGGVIMFDYAHISNRYLDSLAMFFRPKEALEQNKLLASPANDSNSSKKHNWIFSFD